MFASGVSYCTFLCVSLVTSALAISLAAMVGHFRARKKSILTTQTFFRFLDRLPVQDGQPNASLYIDIVGARRPEIARSAIMG